MNLKLKKKCRLPN
jgi:hypothetical protein